MIAPSNRGAQLLAGLLLYSFSMALLLQAGLGGMPWDVLHQGIARTLGVSIGVAVLATTLVVLLCWIPLRQRPGVGTIANVIVIAATIDLLLMTVPAPTAPGVRVAYVIAGVGLNAVATAAYIGAALGPGPRDGLMTGVVRRSGQPVWLIRTAIEVSVVTAGWLLGGTLGIATVAYALLIGPLAQPMLPLFAHDRTSRRIVRRNNADEESPAADHDPRRLETAAPALGHVHATAVPPPAPSRP